MTESLTRTRAHATTSARPSASAPSPTQPSRAADKGPTGTFVITGADGFLGSILVRRLAEAGCRVRAGIGPTQRHHLISDLDIERFDIDVRRPHDLDLLFDTPEPATIIHAAGIVSLASHPTKQLWQTNVMGTANVINAARRHGAKRLVHMSTVHVVPPSASGGSLRENDRFDPDLVIGGYAKTKAAATRLVRDAADLDRVIIMPSGFSGPGDPGPGPVNQVIRDLSTGRLPIIVAGGNDFTDIRDVVKAVLRAASISSDGRSYLLSRGWVSMSDFARMVTQQTGRRMPRTLPLPLAHLGVGPAQLVAAIRRVPASLTSYSLHALKHPTNYDHTRAATELGYVARPLVETVRDVLAESSAEHRPAPRVGAATS